MKTIWPWSYVGFEAVYSLNNLPGSDKVGEINDLSYSLSGNVNIPNLSGLQEKGTIPPLVKDRCGKQIELRKIKVSQIK